MVYTTVSGRKDKLFGNYPNNNQKRLKEENKAFSNETNSTLDKMKKNY